MGSRIITLQRQARELGRLRTGYSVPNDDPSKRPRAVRSQTWIISSHAEHYVEAAADVWGGTVEKWQPQGNGAPQWRVITKAASLDAILPPGDPLSQSYELWSAGGAQRRCDGMSETLSDQPCLCRAQWGENFHETAPRDRACKMTTRLNVILPEMPDIGAWRVETHSYHAANEIAAAVDVLKGSIGTEALIPVRLRIEQRTRVAQGKTKQFPVVAVELRGSTAGQVLAGAAQPVPVGGGQTSAAVEQGNKPALEAPAPATPPVPTPEEFLARARAVTTFAAFKTIWNEAAAAGISPTQAQTDEMTAIGKRLKAAEQPPAALAGDPDLIWQQIVAAWPGTTSELHKRFLEASGGVASENAGVEDLTNFLAQVKAGAVA
ncbi:recombination directionality factor [Nonomuraea sp. SBT364]|uniref:recombination directionality factor n=1 Tax=Nonomuraea sp. SBT364 TaxID=1580530 RepID=UPI00069D6E8F|nr:hypothetical protein [Nonomuraea sp. SBT364]